MRSPPSTTGCGKKDAATSWSVATRNYTFIWGMCGENDDYNDMDWCATKDLK